MIPIKSGTQKIILKKLDSKKRDLTETWDISEFSIEAIAQSEDMFDKEFKVDKEQCGLHIEGSDVYVVVVLKRK